MWNSWGLSWIQSWLGMTTLCSFASIYPGYCFYWRTLRNWWQWSSLLGDSLSPVRDFSMPWEHAAASRRVLVIQKKAKRLICGAQIRDHCRPLFTQSNLITVYNQFILTYLETMLGSFQSRGEIHRQELCSSRRNMSHHWCRLKKTREGFHSLAVGLLNGLPDRVQSDRNREGQKNVVAWEEPF